MNPRRTVVLGLTIALAVYGSAVGLRYVNEERGGKRIANPLPQLGGVELLIAWGVIFTFLTIMADIPATGELAASFTWLIVLAMLFTYGVEAFSNLAVMIGGGGSESPTPDKPPTVRIEGGREIR